MRKVVSILLAVLMLTAMGTVAVTSASAEETETTNEDTENSNGDFAEDVTTGTESEEK